MPDGKAAQGSGLRSRITAAIRRARQVGGLVPARDRRTLALAGLLASLAGGLMVAVLALLARLVNVVDIRPEQQPAGSGLIGWYLGLMGLTILAREACQLLGKFLVQRTGTRLGKELTIALAARLHRADLGALGAEPVGARLGRLRRGAEWVVRLLPLAFLELLPAVGTLVFALAYALATQPWIGLVLLGIIPAVMWIEVRQLTAEKGVHADLLRCKDRVDGMVVEQFGGIEYLRAANMHGREIDRVAAILEDWRIKQLRHYLRIVLFGSLRLLNGWLFQFAVIAVAVALYGLGKMRIGDIAVYGNLFFSVYIPLWRIHFALEEAQENDPRIDDLLAGLAEPLDRSLTGPATPLPPPTGTSVSATMGRQPELQRGMVLFETRDVVVEYRGVLGRKKALDEVSLAIHAGEVVGIAGPSGSGKSTLVKLLLRLVHAAAGEAILGGVPLEAVSREALGRLVGYVGQEPFLFAGTVAENIAYGRDSASAADIRRAAELADLHDDILRLPGGYGAAVGERGRNLSGGQRQRLALARVLLHDPPILILDEATSALDPATERRVLRSLVAGRGSRTVLMVAHRPSALRAADRVLVFADGRLVEEGTYLELLRRRGTFAELVGGRNVQPALSAT